MKACIILQRRFAYVGNEIAALLKERHGVSEFCAFVSTRESYNFLRDQKDVAYTTLLLDEDVHNAYREEKLDLEFLNNLEREYGIPNLWQYIENDRIVRYGQLLREYPYNTPPYTHEEMLRMMQASAKKVLTFLEHEKPDFVVYTVVGGMTGMFLYNIAKKKGIRTLVIHPARVGIKQIVSEDYCMFTSLRANPEGKYKEEAREFLRVFRSNPTSFSTLETLEVKSPSRARHFRFLAPGAIFDSLRFQSRLWTGYFRREEKNDYSTITPWHLLIDKLKRKLRILIGYGDLYDPMIPGEPYAFFPLQLEPEITTTLYSPIYNDYLWVAKQVAKSLPVGYKLYIKEHLAMFGSRTRAFYKELKKIPNVKLINPNTKSFPLILGSRLITVVTSTVGWEAITLKKPVITFGDVFYNALPFVRKCDSIKDLPSLVKEQLEEFTHDEERLVDFIASINSESVEVDLADIWEKEHSSRAHERKAELAPLAALIFSKMRV